MALITLPPLSGCFESFCYSGQSEVRSGTMTTCCVVNANMDQSGDPGNQYCMTKHDSSYPQIVYCLCVSGVWNYPIAFTTQHGGIEVPERTSDCPEPNTFKKISLKTQRNAHGLALRIWRSHDG